MFQNVEDVKTFIFAGKSYLTAKSLKTNRHFTYKFRKLSGRDWPFVFVLKNNNRYDYIGMLDNEFNIQFTNKSKLPSDNIKLIALAYILKNLTRNQIPNNLQLSHNGQCAKCGKKLTDPTSIQKGIGPQCLKMTKKF